MWLVGCGWLLGCRYLNSFGMARVEAHNLKIRAQAWAGIEKLAIPGALLYWYRP
jgi:hypothetical protein